MKLSIITVNLDNLEGLTRTIRSVGEQDARDFEFVVVDGASTDGSAELLRSDAAGSARWVSEKDSGIYAAMNKGIELASGDYLLFLNSGDRLADAGVVGRLLGLLDSRFDIYYADLTISDGATASRITYPRSIAPDFFVSSTISHQNALIRRSMLLEAGRYREDFRISSDWYFFLDASLRLGASFHWIDADIAVMDPGGMGSDPRFSEIKELERERGFADAFGLLAPAMNELRRYRSSDYGHLVELFGASRGLDFVLRVYGFFARRLGFLRSERRFS